MAIEIGNGKKALSMTIVNIDTKDEMLLYERAGSRCFFNNNIFFGEYIITLRYNATKYKSSFAVKLALLSDGKPFPDTEEVELINTYDQCVKSMLDNIVIESNILLLGDQQIIAAFREYNFLFTALHALYDVKVKYEDLMNAGYKSMKPSFYF